MKSYVQLFESWHREEEIVLTSRQGREIKILTAHGKIEKLDNQSGVRFPFFEGQPITVFMKQWACNHGFKWNGENPCPEEKIFGIKTSLVPKSHEWRHLFPGKFRD